MRSLRSWRRLEVLEVGVIVVLVLAGPVLILRPHSSEAQASIGGFSLAAALVGALTLLDAKRREGVADKARHDAGRDETRRLLYAAYCTAGRNADNNAWELGGTVANAVAHHWGGRSQADACALGEKITRGSATQEELLQVIDEITAELGDAAPEQ